MRVAVTTCWICNDKEADSGEHMTKRSDLASVLGKPTQDRPLYFHDIERQNRRVTGLNSGILKSPIRICQQCNSTHTQPHDRAWECMSKQLRERELFVGRWVRANKIFPCRTRPHMIRVQLYFLKLFGCMLCEAKETGHDLGIDVATFSHAFMMGMPHPRGFPPIR
jgi:hypothetical protein